MKPKQLLLSAFALIFSATSWANVEINETTFPDEEFRNWVLSQDYGKDGVLTEAELTSVKIIFVVNMNIQSLKGIEYFTGLTTLKCYNNQLTELDVSKNTKLVNLQCYNNHLSSLDVSKNTQLGSLACHCNQIKGSAMDALVESLPTTYGGILYVLYYENEQNVLTTEQVEAAKARKWKPYACFGFDNHVYNWKEYAGSDPNGIIKPTSNLSRQGERYDLSGRLLSAPPTKGVFIQDGHKVVR